ncbi:MAG: TetR/AcrR family transcriptional regulator [Candidatus Krumholzibacteria bacterium]|nr:TetR/AcrR family transcriptional regulator [Candidatus Krumholzibacteria bacterium]
MKTGARTKRKREQQRQDILVAARELFLREGSARFTMRKLAREVGCVPGTLYLYFKDKNDLIAVLVEESFERLMDDLERPRTDISPLVRLKEMMHAYIEFGLANPNHYHFAFMLRRTRSLEKARPRPHRSYALLLNTVRACVDQQLIRQVDTELAAQGVWTGIHGVTSLMITIPNFPWGDRDTVIDHVVDSLIEGLHPSSEADPETEGDADDH